MIFPDKWYDVIKWIASVALPASATLILALGQIWNFSDIAVPIGATIGAVAAFLGALLGISSIQYKKLTDKKEDK